MSYTHLLTHKTNWHVIEGSLGLRCFCVQVRDAVAVIQLLMWLEKAVPDGKETELSAAEYVNKCRKCVGT